MAFCHLNQVENEAEEEKEQNNKNQREVEPELLEIINAVRHVVARDPLAADFQLSLFASAVFSQRYASVAQPLPPEFDRPGGIDELMEVLDSLPSLRLLVEGETSVALAQPTALRLLRWLLTPAAPAVHVPEFSPSATLRALPRPPPSADCPAPCYLFQVIHPILEEAWREIAQEKKTVSGYIGGPLDGFFSTVHCGVRPGGNIIKIHRNLKAALADSTWGYGVSSSDLGARLRCVAGVECVVEVPGLAVSAAGDDQYLAMRDGKLARVMRLYVFRCAQEESPSNCKEVCDDIKGGEKRHANSQQGAEGVCLKLPEFKFEIELGSEKQEASLAGSTESQMTPGASCNATTLPSAKLPPSFESNDPSTDALPGIVDDSTAGLLKCTPETLNPTGRKSEEAPSRKKIHFEKRGSIPESHQDVNNYFDGKLQVTGLVTDENTEKNIWKKPHVISSSEKKSRIASIYQCLLQKDKDKDEEWLENPVTDTVTVRNNKLSKTLNEEIQDTLPAVKISLNKCKSNCKVGVSRDGKENKKDKKYLAPCPHKRIKTDEMKHENNTFKKGSQSLESKEHSACEDLRFRRNEPQSMETSHVLEMLRSTQESERDNYLAIRNCNEASSGIKTNFFQNALSRASGVYLSLNAQQRRLYGKECCQCNISRRDGSGCGPSAPSRSTALELPVTSSRYVEGLMIAMFVWAIVSIFYTEENDSLCGII